MSEVYFVFIKSAVLCVLLFLVGAPLARKLGWVDRPDARKCHDRPVPLIGGLVICCCLWCVLPYIGASSDIIRIAVLTSVLLIMGALDDLLCLSPQCRLILQLLLVILLFHWAHVRLLEWASFLGLHNLVGWIVIPVGMIFLVGYVNAFNMIDGLNGLAASVALVQLLWLLIYAMALHNVEFSRLILIMMIWLGIFLMFNVGAFYQWRSQAFLGNAGSVFIGAWLAVLAIQLSQSAGSTIYPITILWVLAHPLFDCLAVLFWRYHNKQPLYVAARDHVHHILESILGARSAVLLMLLASSVLASIGYLLQLVRLEESLNWLCFISIFFCYQLGILRMRGVILHKKERNGKQAL